jgi:hypothetical protein
MSEKRRRLDDGSAVEFFVRDYASVDNELMLFGRDSTGGSVCVRSALRANSLLVAARRRPSAADDPFCSLACAHRDARARVCVSAAAERACGTWTAQLASRYPSIAQRTRL